MVGNGGTFELDLDVEVLSVANCGRSLSQYLFGIGAGEGGESEAVLYFMISQDVESMDNASKWQSEIKDTFGSCKSSFSQRSAVLIDRVGSHVVEGSSL